MPHSKHFLCIDAFAQLPNDGDVIFNPHFIPAETEAQKDEIIPKVTELGCSRAKI